MSQVKVSGNASGTGIFTIAAPNSSTNRTLTLPDNTGTLLSSGSTGTVLQVVSVAKTDTWSTLSGSWTGITGLSASITPASTSSKILVMSMVFAGSDQGTNAGGAFRLYRDASLVTGATGNTASNRTTGWSQASAPVSSPWYGKNNTLVYLDSPATASSTTYQIYARAENTTSGTTVNYTYNDSDQSDRVRMISTITLMEIAG